MKIILVLIFLGLFVALGFLAAFIWAVKSGQYTDDVSPAMRILIEDDMMSDMGPDIVGTNHSLKCGDSKQHELKQ